MDSLDRRRAYARSVRRLTLGLLAIWALSSFGAGIVFRPVLDQWSVGGAPLGFWMAQQGSIYIFVALIFIYCWGMNRIERRYQESVQGDVE